MTRVCWPHHNHQHLSQEPSCVRGLYRGLGLELLCTTVEEHGAGRTFYRFAMRFPQGGPKLVLHNNPQQQFTYPSISVEDTAQAYRQLGCGPAHLWFEAHHASPRGCEALVRLDDCGEIDKQEFEVLTVRHP